MRAYVSKGIGVSFLYVKGNRYPRVENSMIAVALSDLEGEDCQYKMRLLPFLCFVPSDITVLHFLVLWLFFFVSLLNFKK